MHHNRPRRFRACSAKTDAEYLAKYAVDRVDTTATVWLASTLACATCHDHKYDPFSQKDFYRFYAFFNSITEEATDRNALAPPPNVRVPEEAQIRQLEDLELAISDGAADLVAPDPELDSAQADWERATAQRIRSRWTPLVAIGTATIEGPTAYVWDEGGVIATGPIGAGVVALSRQHDMPPA